MITRPPNEQVFSRVAIDYIEKKPRTALGNRYALMIIDQTSRYTTADSSPTATAEDTVRIVTDCLLNEWGFPDEIVCDNGRHFTGRPFRRFCEKNGIN